MNICAEFDEKPSTKYRETVSREIGVHRRTTDSRTDGPTTRKQYASKLLLAEA